MIDLLSETPITLAEAGRRLPGRNAKTTSPVTVWRWTSRGIRGIKLETAQLGGRTVTTVEALRRFLARLNGNPISETPAAESSRVELALDRAAI